jgi:TonB family protein
MRAVQIALCVLAGAVIPAGSAQADQRPEVVGLPVIVPTSSPVSVRPGRQPLPVEDSVLRLPDPETTCEDGAAPPLYSEILPAQVQGWGPLDGDTVLTFSIAADGRTMDIRPAGSAPAAFDTLQAGLAAWRFPAQARKDCRLTVRWRNTPLAEAETPDLLNYFAVNRDRGGVRDAVVKRLGGPGADCGERFGGRRPAVMAYPDFKQGRRPPPGGRSWTVVRWNIDAEGRTTDIETLGSSGDSDLDAEARRATAESRMQPGPARTGCVYNFYRIGETLPAPPRPIPAPSATA